jgi:hypothetical protein
MTDVFGLSLAALLIIAGVVVLVAAAVIHWILIVIGLGIIAVALYFLFTGGFGPV